MNDLVESAAGSQSTDRAFKWDHNKATLIPRAQIIRPVWQLVPLEHYSPLARRSSLHSLCLGVVSNNLHLYTIDDLSALPRELARRILHRARSDRGYDFGDVQRNPDVATLWAYQAVLDPPATSLTLALPVAPTLHHLANHPLVLLPKRFTLLTTLTLDSIDNVVNDDTIVNLRYCTHLAVLWTKGCGITDHSVRLLSAALDLVNKRGLCRLRAWFLPGCKGISDASMRSLARWPGLIAVDVRGTSVTSSGMDVFNRYSRLLFGGQNADFQPCTEGLRGIFETASPQVTLDALFVLMGSEGATLHIIPTTLPLEPAWLPHAPRPKYRHVEKGTYLSGIGTLYGNGVQYMPDSAQGYRDDLRSSLWSEEDEEELSEREEVHWRAETVPTHKPRRRDDQSRVFVTDTRVAKSGRRFQPRLMLVRMVNPAWESFTWSTVASAGVPQVVSIRSQSIPTRNVSVSPFTRAPTVHDPALGKRRRFDAPDVKVKSRKGLRMFVNP